MCLQALAKLSADNVVLMVKLRKAEGRCGSLEKECAELREAVQSQSGAWFDDVRDLVQQRLEESTATTQQLQRQRDQEREAHALRLKDAQDAKDQLAAHLSSTLSSCQQLEGDLQESQCALRL